MYCHLVSIKIGVERLADKRRDSDGLAFYQDRHERLNAEAMQRRWAVEQHGVVLDNFFQYIPHGALRGEMLHIGLGAFDGAAVTVRL